jgi:hypothetical protein
MSEVHAMFSYAGITIPEEEIEGLFFRAATKDKLKNEEGKRRFRSAESLRYKLKFCEPTGESSKKHSIILGENKKPKPKIRK